MKHTRKKLLVALASIVIIGIQSCMQRESSMQVAAADSVDETITSVADTMQATDTQVAETKMPPPPAYSPIPMHENAPVEKGPATTHETKETGSAEAKGGNVDVAVEPQNSEGTVVYYCPSRMMENANNNVSVTITKAEMEQAIKQLENRIVATTGQPAEKIAKDINGSTITIAPKMKVELKYSDKDFETIYKPEYADQFFDGKNSMTWDWIVKPLKVGNNQLSIIVSAYDEKNGRWVAVQSPPRIFTIKVQVDPRGYFAKLWGFLEQNPEWLFVQIIFPVVAYFFGKRKGKAKGKKA